jgi:type IV pilus assembly protein PilB
VRTICKECKEEDLPSPEALKDIGMEKGGTKFYRGRGCAKCLKTGYRGRVGIYELMIPDQKIQTLTLQKAAHGEIKKQAQSAGMTTLREDGIRKVREGMTTIEEVLRVTQREE